MDTNTAQAQTNQATDTTEETSHITQELYKKNFELAAKNKTLSLLRKIDEIILGSVTDINQIAQQVANTVALEAEFKAVVIYLLDKKEKALIRLTVSNTEDIKKIAAQFDKRLYNPKILLSDTTNILIQTLQEKQKKVSHDIHEIISKDFQETEIANIQQVIQIRSSLIYPLIARGETTGIMLLSLAEEEKAISQYENDLIDRLAGVVSIAIDNTLLYQRIQEANEKLKQMDALKDEFVSLASHELRTPMTAIKSYLWLVLQQKNDIGSLNDKQKLYLDRTYQSTQRLIDLVNDMLNVSRIEAGRLIVNPVPTDMVKLSQEALTEVMPKAQEQKISVTVATPSSTIPHVSADPAKIKEVLINLIGNSLKFTPAGGKILVSFIEKDGMVITSVTDTGKGIKQEDIGKLFQKFEMLGDGLPKQSVPGTGLGLYISRSIVRLHGGDMWVASEGVGKGATFSFSLKKRDE